MKDEYRLLYHLMPDRGWLNDPNGLCQVDGTYHVFFQYSKDDVNGGQKYWGHYKSSNLTTWEFLGAVIAPDSDYDRSGAYSGCAYVLDNKMYIFYTGNVKEEGEHDYITSGRESNTILTVTEDGINFSKKEVLLSFSRKSYPLDYTCHIRDPKVLYENGKYYMVLGGRKKDDVGAVLLYGSDDMHEWVYINEITTKNKFGYMWECPDLFKLGKIDILSVSPQGLKAGYNYYQNIYQSGYFFIKGDYTDEYELSEFREWDMGFDFYAPQTFEDENGRRILIGWVGMPDATYTNPTVASGWQHCLTVPRELILHDNIIIQRPVTEIDSLRSEVIEGDLNQGISLKRAAYDLVIDNIVDNDFSIDITDGFSISIKENEVSITFTKNGYGRDIRRAVTGKVMDIRVLIDTSVLEIYINGGRTVFTTRYYGESEVLIKTNVEAADITLYKMREMEMGI